MLVHTIYLTGASRSLGLDPTPLAFTLTGMLYAWGIFRRRLFDLVPLARHTLIDIMSDGVIVVDARNRIIDINASARAMLAVGARPLIGEVAATCVGSWSEIGAPARATDGPMEILVHGDDGSRWLDVDASAWRDRSGRSRGRLIVLRDMTDRKRAEQQLRLAAIVEHSEDAIVAAMLDGTITSWNAGAERLYGYAAGDVIGRSLSVLARPDDPDELPRMLARIARGERVEPHETVHTKDGGAGVEVAVTVSPIRDAAGRITGASVTSRDVTERRRLEDVTRRAEALRYVATLATAAAHEINNPLNVVRVNLQLLARGRGGGDGSQLVETAVAACDRIHGIVCRLNRITRLELASQSPSLPEMLDLDRSSAEAGEALSGREEADA